MSNLSSGFKYNNAVIRPVKDKDILFLVELINEAYSYQDEAKGTKRTNPDHLRKRVSETEFFLVEVEDKIEACVYLEPRGESLHFGLLTVTPKYRGKGLAQAIMAAIESHAAGKYELIELDYMSLAPWLKKYYEKYGFKETGQVTKWGSIDLIRMSKPVLKI